MKPTTISSAAPGVVSAVIHHVPGLRRETVQDFSNGLGDLRSVDAHRALVVRIHLQPNLVVVATQQAFDGV
jgi:hypothetical protein